MLNLILTAVALGVVLACGVLLLAAVYAGHVLRAEEERDGRLDDAGMPVRRVVHGGCLARSADETEGVGRWRLATRVHQCWCGIVGHWFVLDFAPEQLSMHCSKCGYASPGFTTDPTVKS